MSYDRSSEGLLMKGVAEALKARSQAEKRTS